MIVNALDRKVSVIMKPYSQPARIREMTAERKVMGLGIVVSYIANAGAIGTRKNLAGNSRALDSCIDSNGFAAVISGINRQSLVICPSSSRDAWNFKSRYPYLSVDVVHPRRSLLNHFSTIDSKRFEADSK